MYNILNCTQYTTFNFIIQASAQVKDLSRVHSVVQAEEGEKGYSKCCFGKNAEHNIVKVPIGTIVRDLTGKILCDLNQSGMMFIAARGGAGGHGNVFFKSDINQSPEICEYGAVGEDLQYVLEIKSMAHVGLVSTWCTNSSIIIIIAISNVKNIIITFEYAIYSCKIFVIVQNI